METAIDKFGRVTVPKKIRDNLGLEAGTTLQIKEKEGKIVFSVNSSKQTLKMLNGVLMYTGKVVGDVQAAVKKDRDSRIGKFL